MIDLETIEWPEGRLNRQVRLMLEEDDTTYVLCDLSGEPHALVRIEERDEITTLVVSSPSWNVVLEPWPEEE